MLDHLFLGLPHAIRPAPSTLWLGTQHYPHGGAAGASLLAPFSGPGPVASPCFRPQFPRPCHACLRQWLPTPTPRLVVLLTSKKRCNTLRITGPAMRPTLLGGSTRNPSRSTGTPQPPLMGDGPSPPASPSSIKGSSGWTL